MAADTGPRVKGVSFRSVMQALEALRGPAAVDSCIDALSDELKAACRYRTLMASSWYPIAWYRELLEAVRASTGETERIWSEIGRQSAYLDMTGVYRMVFKLLSPQAVFNLTTRMFSNYYDTGTCKIVDSRTGYAHARWTGCVGFNRALWLDVFGASETFLELAGAKNVRWQIVRGGGNDEEFAELVGRWT